MENACNIGPHGQKRRKMIGQVLIVIAGALSGYLIAAHAPWSTRLMVFPFFAGGFICLLEGERKVCVWLANQGKVDAR